MPFEKQLETLKNAQLLEKLKNSKPVEMLKNTNPVARRVAALALVGAGAAAVVLLGPLHGVFDGAHATANIEYGAADVQIADYVSASDDSVTVDIQGTIDTEHVGTQTVPITLSKWFISNPDEVDVVVADTQAPEVTFKKDTIACELGETVHPADNVASVMDPVDGPLAPVAAEPAAQGTEVGTEQFYDQGWYMAATDFVAKEAGTTDVTVTACDQFGNRTDATFSLKVIDPLEGVNIHKTDKVIEYGKDKVDPVTQITCTDDETTVTADPVDASKIGKKVVDFTLTKRKSTKTIQRTFYVRDSQPPVIEIEATEVNVPQYEAYDPVNNVRRVEDPVDGGFMRQMSAPEAKSDKVGRAQCYDSGWYVVDGTVDVNTLGSYPVVVTASDQHGNEATLNFVVNVVDPLAGLTLTGTTTVEYGRGSINPATLVTCSDSTVQLSAPALDITKVGSKTVTFTLTKGKSSRTMGVDFTVRDTQAPDISVRSDAVTVGLGKAYDPFNNVVIASDPVDGALTRVSSPRSKAGNGWWTVTGSYDLNRAGTYALQVLACDRNGNQSSRNFTLTVE